MRRTMTWIATALLMAFLAVGFIRQHWAPGEDTKRIVRPFGSENSPEKFSVRDHVDLATAANAGNKAGVAKPLPPPGTPLKQILSDLESRAYVGDAQAASRLYDDLGKCARVHIANRTTPANSAQVLSEVGGPNSPAATQATDARLDGIQRNLDFTRANAALCAGIDASDVAHLVPATLQAARLGNTQAADCYVMADLNTWFNLGLSDNPQWMNDYKENALDIAKSAVQGGDWAMVNELDWAYRGGFSAHNLLPQVTGLNLAQAYAYEKLWALGHPADAAHANVQTQYLANYAAQMKLSQTDIQAAEAQAQDMYQKYFNTTSGQGVPRNTLQACQLSLH